MPKPKKSMSNEKNSMHLLEFWSRITPSILVLLGKNEPVSFFSNFVFEKWF